MAYKVILAPRSIRDLEQVVRYIAPENAEKARQFGMALIEKTKILSVFPQMGRVVPEFREEHIRELIFKSYRIVYRVNHAKQTVEVSRFWHAARGMPILETEE